jgi:hypothetical protein
MLRRGREQKTLVEKELRLLVPIWYKRRTLMHHIKRRTKELVVLFAGVLITRQVLVQTVNLSKRKNQLMRRKTTNMVVSETAEGTSGYGNLLPTVLSVC